MAVSRWWLSVLVCAGLGCGDGEPAVVGQGDASQGASGGAGAGGLAGQGGASQASGQGGVAMAGQAAGPVAGQAGAAQAGGPQASAGQGGQLATAGNAGSAGQGAPSLQFVPIDEAGLRRPPVTTLLWGDEVAMRACGLGAGETVQLRVRVANYTSEALFSVGADGCIDTGLDAPLPGAWEGADADGPFWTQAPSGKPPTDNAAFLPVVAAVLRGDEALVEATLQRVFSSDDVTHIDVSDAGLVGTFAVPAGPGPFPAVLAFGGSEGGLRSGAIDANQLASKGYAVLGVAYFAEPGLPTSLESIPLEYLESALAWLAGRAEVDASRIAVKGASRGGELALQLGATFSVVKAVVASVPSGYRWGAVSGDGPAWTYQGEPLASVPFAIGASETVVTYDGTKARASSGLFVKSIEQATPQQLDAATIAVEATAGPVLLIGGAEDALWPSCLLAEVASKRLEQSGHSAAHADKLVCLPGAGHSATGLPGFSTLSADHAKPPGAVFAMAMGGSPAGIAHAQREARRLVLRFLGEALGHSP